MAHGPYPYSDPFFTGSIVTFGPPAINQPQILPHMSGLPSARVALPLDLAEDGPIYVNAKQYHGILRRRQSRAKLEAQNKLIKSRKPYLHESRHRHALNRVRGSGGRFLSTKQLQQFKAELSSGSHSDSDNKLYPKKDALDMEGYSSSIGKNLSTVPICSGQTSLSGDSINKQQQHELMFLANPANMSGALQCSEGLTFGGTKQHAPIVR